MAHIVGQPKPDVVFSRDVDGGCAMLFDVRTHEQAELSEDATTVLEVDTSICGRAVERARSGGVQQAADEVELEIRLTIGQGDEARLAQRVLLEALADIAVREWVELAGRRAL